MNIPPHPSPTAPDRSRHAATRIFERLREQILSLELPPATLLSRGELALQHRSSLTPVRDALMRLSDEGLVEVYPQHATLVSRIDVDAAMQSHFLRQSIELEVVRTLAGRRDDAFLAELRSQLAVQRQSQHSGQIDRFSALDRAFHRLMYEAAGVPHLWELVRRTSGHIYRLRRLHLPLAGKAHAILDDHALLVEAIARGDAREARAVVRRHFSGALEQLDELRARYPHFLSEPRGPTDAHGGRTPAALAGRRRS